MPITITLFLFVYSFFEKCYLLRGFTGDSDFGIYFKELILLFAYDLFLIGLKWVGGESRVKPGQDGIRSVQGMVG